MPLLSRHRIVLPVVWVIAAAYLFAGYDRGWIEHDAGTLGQIAERVLDGEMPHRDFDDPYTGGLSYLHAAGFAVLGTSLHSLRVMLVAWTLVFLPAVYAIAVRAVPAWGAGLIALLCLAWSVPNYYEAMPSWFNLFCAAFGTLALLKHIETGRLRWVFVAGLWGGVSFLFKSVGLYYVAAVLLFLVYREQSLSSRDDEDGPNLGYSAFVALGLLAFLAALGNLVGGFAGSLMRHHESNPAGFETLAGSRFGSLAMLALQFALPAIACTVLLLRNEWRLRRLTGKPRWIRLTRLGLPFLAGAALPVAAFLVPYLVAGGLGTWFEGVFVKPLQRLDDSAHPLPPLGTIWTAIPLAALLAWPAVRARLTASRTDGFAGTSTAAPLPEAESSAPPSPTAASSVSTEGGPLRDLQVAAMVLAVAVAGVIVAVGSAVTIYASVWHSMRHALPFVVLAGCAALWSRNRQANGELDSRTRQKLFLVLAMAALVSLVQIPQAWGVYFCYAAPMIVLAAAFVVSTQPFAPRRVFAWLAVFYLAFAATWMNRNDVRRLPDGYHPVEEYAPLAMERGGIRVPRAHAEIYGELVKLVQSHSPDGSFFFATPDAPQAYFLCAQKNPTRTLFDLFDDDWNRPRGRAARLARVLDAHDVRVAILSYRAEFSIVVRDGIVSPAHDDILKLVRSRFPNVKLVTFPGSDGGARPPAFEVRW
ncbi:MAG: glycosyltransferase family 39 protein [Planctomycetaceae bacterium]